MSGGARAWPSSARACATNDGQRSTKAPLPIRD
jgi:hypothetical protein